jgi:hypothetical protein
MDRMVVLPEEKKIMKKKKKIMKKKKKKITVMKNLPKREVRFFQRSGGWKEGVG